ncbi:MAG: hypothetical protein ACP6IQ_07125 [Candidatus Njordarchaeia archaeon]
MYTLLGLSEIKKIKKEEDRFIILIDDLRELNLLDGLSLDKDDGEEEIPPDENVELIINAINYFYGKRVMDSIKEKVFNLGANDIYYLKKQFNKIIEELSAGIL